MNFVNRLGHWVVHVDNRRLSSSSRAESTTSLFPYAAGEASMEGCDRLISIWAAASRTPRSGFEVASAGSLSRSILLVTPSTETLEALRIEGSGEGEER